MKVSKLIKKVFPAKDVVEAHCDGPCGVYDPASARIAAEAALSMTKKLLALSHPDHSDEQAVEKIAAVLGDSSKQRELLEHLAGCGSRFSTDRFVQEIRGIMGTDAVLRFLGDPIPVLQADARQARCASPCLPVVVTDARGNS